MDNDAPCDGDARRRRRMLEDGDGRIGDDNDGGRHRTTADDDNDDGRRRPTQEDEDGRNGDDNGDGRQRTTHDDGRQRKTTDDDGDDARRRTTADSLSYLVLNLCSAVVCLFYFDVLE